jgi:hypothetical protein
MGKPRLKECIKHVFPGGWKPSIGQYVIVPGKTTKRGWTGIVEVVLDDIIRVRVPRFKNGRQEWLLRDVRPHPYLKAEEGKPDD